MTLRVSLQRWAAIPSRALLHGARAAMGLIGLVPAIELAVAEACARNAITGEASEGVPIVLPSLQVLPLWATVCLDAFIGITWRRLRPVVAGGALLRSAIATIRLIRVVVAVR